MVGRRRNRIRQNSKKPTVGDVTKQLSHQLRLSESILYKFPRKMEPFTSCSKSNIIRDLCFKLGPLVEAL
jgi:hypothetical protein